MDRGNGSDHFDESTSEFELVSCHGVVGVETTAAIVLALCVFRFACKCIVSKNARGIDTEKRPPHLRLQAILLCWHSNSLLNGQESSDLDHDSSVHRDAWKRAAEPIRQVLTGAQYVKAVDAIHGLEK